MMMSGDFQVRRMASGDLQKVLELENLLFSDAWTKENLEDTFKYPYYHCFVVNKAADEVHVDKNASNAVLVDENAVDTVFVDENAVGEVHGDERAAGDPVNENAVTEVMRIEKTAGEPVGYLLFMTAADEGELLRIGVEPAFRKQGLGQLLMNAMEDCAQEEKLSSIFLEVRESNLAAQNLYQKNGFTVTGIRKKYYHDPLENATLMMRVFEEAEPC